MRIILPRSISCLSPAEPAEQRSREPKGNCWWDPAGVQVRQERLGCFKEQSNSLRQDTTAAEQGKGECRILEAVPAPMWKASNQVNKVQVGGRIPSLGHNRFTQLRKSMDLTVGLGWISPSWVWWSLCWKAGRGAVPKASTRARGWLNHCTDSYWWG